jgi:hypothetical protein
MRRFLDLFPPPEKWDLVIMELRRVRSGAVFDLDGAEDADREQYGADDDAVADPLRLLAAPQRRLHHAATADLLLVPPPQPPARGAPTRPRSTVHAPPQAAAFGAPGRSTKEIGGGSTLRPVRNGMGTGGAWGSLQRLGVGSGGGAVRLL